MAEFPILDEFKNIIYYNLETIFLVLMPMVALIGWLANRVINRIKDVEADNDKKIEDIKLVIAEVKTKLDRLQGKLSTLEVDIVSDVESIKTLLNQGFKDVNYLKKRKKRNDDGSIES